MSERLRESLSALMDDEADDLELGRILRAMEEEDSELTATWSRYQLVSAILQGRVSGQGLGPLALDLKDAVVEEDVVASEYEAGSEHVTARGPRWRGLTSFAVAASLTAVAVVGWQWQAPTAETAEEAPRAAPESRFASPVRTPDRGAMMPATQQPMQILAREGGPMQSRVTLQTAPSPEETARQQVEGYMVRHAEHNALHSRSGMVPFARMAAFDGAQ